MNPILPALRLQALQPGAIKTLERAVNCPAVEEADRDKILRRFLQVLKRKLFRATTHEIQLRVRHVGAAGDLHRLPVGRAQADAGAEDRSARTVVMAQSFL